jgi:hypothetical protein
VSEEADLRLLEVCSQIPLRKNLTANPLYEKYFRENPMMRKFAEQAIYTRGVDGSSVLKEIFDAISQEYEACAIYGKKLRRGCCQCRQTFQGHYRMEPSAMKTHPMTTRRRDKTGYLMSLPYVIYFCLFIGFPLIFSFVLVFHKWNIVTPMQWIGLRNFYRLFQDVQFFVSIRNTLVFLVIHIPLQIAVALLLAVLLNQKIKCRAFSGRSSSCR